MPGKQSVKQLYESYPYPNRALVCEADLYAYLRWFLNATNIGKPWLVGKRILEIGCGTGELATALSIAGAKVTAVDLSLNSLKNATVLKKRFNAKNLDLVNGNALSLPVKFDEKFDLVLSLGVLHYTGDTENAIELASAHVEVGGFMCIGLYNRIGRIRMRAKRAVIKAVAGNDAEKKMKVGKKLFGVGNPAMHEDVWLADKYAVPVESYHSVKEVVTQFKKLNFNVTNIRPKLKGKSFVLNEVDWFLKKKGAFFIVTGQK